MNHWVGAAIGLVLGALLGAAAILVALFPLDDLRHLTEPGRLFSAVHFPPAKFAAVDQPEKVVIVEGRWVGDTIHFPNNFANIICRRVSYDTPDYDEHVNNTASCTYYLYVETRRGHLEDGGTPFYLLGNWDEDRIDVTSNTFSPCRKIEIVVDLRAQTTQLTAEPKYPLAQSCTDQGAAYQWSLNQTVFAGH